MLYGRIDIHTNYILTIVHITKVSISDAIQEKFIVARIVTNGNKSLILTRELDITIYQLTHQISRAVSSMKCLRPLKNYDRVFELHLRHVCLCTFILCVQVAALRRVDPPSKESCRLSTRLRN
jgi:hypothetical protein